MNAILYEEAARLDSASGREGKRERGYREGQLAELWRATGLESVKETALAIQTDFRSFDDYWLAYTSGAGATAAFVAGLPSERREALREALRKRLLSGGPDHPFPLRARAWAVRGTAPGH